jgi:hypothetical protein
VLIPETGPVSERLRVREIDDDEGQRLVRIIRRGSGMNPGRTGKRAAHLAGATARRELAQSIVRITWTGAGRATAR